MEAIKVLDGKLVLPRQAIKWIGNATELQMFIEGDTLILKRLNKPALSEIAARAAADDEIPLDEIVAEVHRYRQERRDAGGR